MVCTVMTRRQRRLILIGSSLGVLVLATVLVLSALKDSIVFFNSPSDVVEKHVAVGTRIRLGGLVKPGTVQRGEQLMVRFEVTDGNSAIPVSYTGVLPDLFREGQGVMRKAHSSRAGVQGGFRAGQARREIHAAEVADALKSKATGRTTTRKRNDR
jgi:cytochrome c-type biogenesis protein CcmE